VNIMTATKSCSRCHEPKPLEAFARDRATKDGLRCWCRECNKASHAAYRAANGAKEKASQAAYRAANHEKRAAYHAAWKAANSDYNAAWKVAKPLYGTWAGMIQRCTNPKHEAHKNYGGRGITVCDRWLTYENWLADILGTLGPRPEGMSLDRIDNDSGYRPGNMRWATATEQRINQRPPRRNIDKED